MKGWGTQTDEDNRMNWYAEDFPLWPTIDIRMWKVGYEDDIFLINDNWSMMSWRELSDAIMCSFWEVIT